jgi:hypothetical protein
VFDLGGTGVGLTALSASAPMLDMLGTGFAVHTGWVGVNDGILVLQQAGQSGTPNITQMFGGPGAEGFAALDFKGWSLARPMSQGDCFGIELRPVMALYDQLRM